MNWLWPPLIQRELDRFCDEANNKRVRKQKSKALPSVVSPNIAHTFAERFGGVDCLQRVDVDLIREMLESDELQEERRLVSDWGVPDQFARKAEQAMTTLRIKQVTLQNIWITFSALLHFLS